ncbi:MAG TPA: vWA domain-containing protein, partial [Vicinamibacterales bacterium]|nr:vWA domain-containing protein [Vicinamibacterales bacterium]
MTSIFHLPAGYNEWRLALGATAHVGRLGVALLFVGAALAIALSMLSLAEERRGRGLVLLGLRVLGVLACLVTALQPTIELRQVTRLPNRVAVLVDTSRSMEVRPPDGGPSRAERAATMLERAAPRLQAWQQAGHEVDLYGFGENVTPATAQSLREPPGADATRIGEALGDVRARYAGRDLGAVVVISDGVDTGRIGEGPLDATTRGAIEALGAPVHTVGLGEKSLRDLSVAAVLADQFAFVRTPASIEAVIRQTGL